MMSSPEDYMIPCLSKKILGFECLGCGIQRASVLMIQGEFKAAFLMYPAIYSLFLLALFLIFNLFLKFKNDEKIKIALVIMSISTIIISYVFKLIN